jgi:signal transduction histidine kinase
MTLSTQIEIEDLSTILTFISPSTDQFLIDQPLVATKGSLSAPYQTASVSLPREGAEPPLLRNTRTQGLPAARSRPLPAKRRKRPSADAIVEQERRRLSRDLHDVSGQYIVAMLFQLAAIERTQGEPSLLQSLAELRTTLTSFSEDLQGLARGVRQGVPRGAHLETAISDLVSQWEGQVGIVARFRHRGLARAAIDDRIAEAAFRIAQEGLTNIAKHAASASLVTVSLEAKGDRLTLEIEDDGTGRGPAPRFDEGRLRPSCGISGMLQRATELGGTLSLRPRRAMPGTRLCATMPLHRVGPPQPGDGVS